MLSLDFLHMWCIEPYSASIVPKLSSPENLLAAFHSVPSNLDKLEEIDNAREGPLRAKRLVDPNLCF